MLLAAGAGSGGVTGLEELVAGTEELLPQLVAQFLGHHAYLLPLLLQVDELVARRLPVGRILQRLCLLDEGALLLSVLLEGVLQRLEELCLAAKEVVAGCTETLEDFHIHLLRCKADGLPLSLQLNDFLRMALPVTAALVLLGCDGLYLLTQLGLLG